VFLLAILVELDAVLTLPGIAALVLTVGMAVDANVLIFERIREELRLGQTVRNAVSRGYDRAFRTILDANVTTLITALVLLKFGTGPVKGFAVTLAVGIVVSMFTALFVTRVVFDLITTGRPVRKLSI
jgi:preprotein translocase subunit SecD